MMRVASLGAAVALAVAAPASAQVTRLGLVGSRWNFDEGTASQPPTVRTGVTFRIGFETVRRLSPQFAATFIPEGDVEPGLVAAAGELRVMLLGSGEDFAWVATIGGGLAQMLAGNRERVVEGCREGCLFEGVSYRSGIYLMSTVGVGFVFPVGTHLALTPGSSVVMLVGEKQRLVDRISLGLMWRR
jgi:hypothetical protein